MLVNAVMGLVPGRSALGPGADDVHERQGPGEVPRERTAAMRHRVRFKVSDPHDILVARTNRDVFLEQRTRLGSTTAFAAHLRTNRGQKTIHGCRTHGPDLV